MIYIIKESLMNGTVTLSTNVCGIEEDDFNVAAVRVRDFLIKYRVPESQIIFKQDIELSYFITGQLTVTGRMDNTPLKMITDDTP